MCTSLLLPRLVNLPVDAALLVWIVPVLAVTLWFGYTLTLVYSGHGWTRRRLALSLAVVVSLAVPAGLRLAVSMRAPWAAMASSSEVVAGQVRRDLRPASDRLRALSLDLDMVRAPDGWEAAAGGAITVFWQGADRLLTTDSSQRLVPQRGDRIVLRASWTPDNGAVLWADTEDMHLRPSGRADHGLRRSIRSWLRMRFLRLPSSAGTLAEALLLGDRSGLPAEQVQTFRTAGAAHVIALSGMHLGVLAGLVWLLLPRRMPPILRGLIPALLLVGYVWVAGWIPSLVRALVLALLAISGYVNDRRFPLRSLIAATVVVVAFVAPALTLELGFQLSVWALVGLAIVSPRASRLLSWVLPPSAARYLGTTLGPLLSTAIPSLVFFGTLYPVGLLSSGVLSVAVVAMMWSTLLWLAVASIPLAGSAVAELVVALAWLVRRIALVAARVPGIELGAAGWVLTTALWCTLVLGPCLVAVTRRNRCRGRLEKLQRVTNQSQFAF